MKCILMNKNTKVMLVEYNLDYHIIEKIYETYNINYAPLSVYNASKNKSLNTTKTVNNWFRGRGIPSWRKDLEGLLERLNVSTTEELLNKAYALSLSDQYWLKEENSKLEWKDINFFTNDFKYQGYLNAALDSSSTNHNLKADELRSPNNTTDGMLQKGWIIENGKRVLVKGTYTFSGEEPFNEWLASNISKRLGFYYCDYKIDLLDDKLVSKCNDFISEDEEIISAYDIFTSEKKPNNISDYNFYIGLLEKNNIINAREAVSNMFIVDYLLMNTDRHLKNFGIIRDVNTLKWLRTTPIFDTGQSMQCDKNTTSMNFNSGEGKFFSNTKKNYEEILDSIGDYLATIDISKLDGLIDEYRSMLEKYQSKTDMSNQRIDKLVNGLKIRISLLEMEIMEYK